MTDASQPAPPDPKKSTVAPATDEIFRAPNGLEIFQHAAAETKYVFREIFEDRVYFRHGIDLKFGETVFDIGANIGIFTIFVEENFKDVKVHAFEPSPVIHRILQRNAAKYGNSVTVHNCGVAGQSGEAKFTFYPHYSIMSGLHASGEDDRETLRSGIKSSLKEQNTDPAEITDRLLDRLAKVALGEKQEYLCQLRTVSEVMEEAGVNAIGLLKIDAEGSELAILEGVREDHWPRIRQIVMEIHDLKGTGRAAVKALLEKRGFNCFFEEEKRLVGSGIVNCYARR